MLAWSVDSVTTIKGQITTTTTQISSQSSAMGTISSAESLLLVILGSSGLAAWCLTYLQLRLERKRHARAYFRELVLTRSFLEYLGAVYTFSRTLVPIKTKEEVAKRSNEIADLTDTIQKAINATILQGTPYLVPQEFIEQVMKVDTLARKVGKDTLADVFNESDRAALEKEADRLGELLRQMLGLSEFDRLFYRLRSRLRKAMKISGFPRAQ
jgi:hypothetical protein